MINVKSEIGNLKTVLLHKPGEEIENLTPDLLERLLFDDIPYLKEAQKEHDAFANILRENGVEVLYLHELMAEVISDEKIKEEFLNQFIREAGINSKEVHNAVYDFLTKIEDNEALVRKTMAGINKKEIKNIETKRLADKIEDNYPFIADPMPNLYFTRDPFATIGHGVSLNKMYSVTRNRETIFGEYIFKYHPRFKNTELLYNRYNEFSIEGGDILCLTENTLAIGISQRTSADAIEELAKNLFFHSNYKNISTILAFNIPKSRAYMHLDTVFTQIDYNKFTIHPGIKGPLEVFEIKASAEQDELIITKMNMELEKILGKYLNRDDIELIECGGGDYVDSHREQWNDGSNTLCIKPGHVVVYSRNHVTNKLLEEHGITIHVMPSSELSRGRGGPRCMSMPIVRE